MAVLQTEALFYRTRLIISGLCSAFGFYHYVMYLLYLFYCIQLLCIYLNKLNRTCVYIKLNFKRCLNSHIF